VDNSGASGASVTGSVYLYGGWDNVDSVPLAGGEHEAWFYDGATAAGTVEVAIVENASGKTTSQQMESRTAGTRFTFSSSDPEFSAECSVE
jgi:hypothetical protein